MDDDTKEITETEALADASELTIQKVWVEIQEEGDQSQIVLKCISGEIPHSRAPRRRLDLQEKDKADLYDSSPSDRVEIVDEGAWNQDGKTLELTIDGWEGKYEIEELTEDTLILKPL